MKNAFSLLVLPLAFALASCDSTGDDGGSGCGSGSMTATIAGASFTAVCVTGSFSSGVLSVAGNLGASEAGSQEQINLALPGAAAGSTVTLGFGATGTYAKGSASNLQTYVSTSGSVAVTAVSATAAKGTFSFTGRTNAGATISIANGTFDIPF